MNGVNQNPVDIRIKIYLPNQYRGKGRAKALEKKIGVYPADLYESLGLPVTVSLDVIANPDNDPTVNGRVRIEIDDRTIQVAVPAGSGDEDISGPGALDEVVAHAIFRAREYVVTGDVARALWRGWSPDRDPTDIGPDTFDLITELVLQAVRYGFSATRLESRIGKIESPDADSHLVRSVFEDCISEVETTGGCLYLTPGHFQQYKGLSGKPESDGSDGKSIPEMLTMMSEGLYYELGLSYGMDVKEDLALPERCYRLQINDMRLPVLRMLGPDEILVNDTADHMAFLNLQDKARASINPANGNEAALLSDAAQSRDICEQAGLTTWAADGYMILAISAAIRTNAGAFMTTAELYTDLLGSAFPHVVECARERFSMQKLTRILRHLLDEGTSIRDLRGILDGLLAVDGVSIAEGSRYILFSPNTGVKAPSDLPRPVAELRAEEFADCIRTVLKRQISHKYTRGGGTLVVLLLSPDIEDRVRKDNGVLAPADRDKIIDAVYAEVGSLPGSYQSPVILTAMDVRYRVRRLLETDFPALAVLAYQELSPELNIQPIARISTDD